MAARSSECIRGRRNPPTEPPEVVVFASHQTGGEPNPAEAGGGMPLQSKKPALVARRSLP